MSTHTTFARAWPAALIFGATLIAGGNAAADQVIADDLIVQGSTCVGLDCVNNESFGFDTLRLKENNTRIKFQDTSTSAGFPSNSWQLTANDSASGGLNKFSIESTTAATVPFTVVGAAPTNSVFVASTGRVGFRTSAPGLDLHITTGDTPAHRLEQTSANGFTAQTWDIGANEANFFVRDLTGGSRLPFRLRPGAPTSSIDIAATGKVGVGTASPATKLAVSTSTDIDGISLDTSGKNPVFQLLTSGTRRAQIGIAGGLNQQASGAVENDTVFRTEGGGNLIIDTNAGALTPILTLKSGNGNVGIGTTAPAAKLHTTGSVRFEGVPNCGSGIVSSANGTLSCLASSRTVKNLAGELSTQTALANIMALRPYTGSYKETPDVPEHWLIAEEVAAVDPALVGLHEGKPHVVKTQNVVADLVAVVQQQQQQIEELRRLVAAK